MRILITGGVGFIGHNVVRLLEAQGHECNVIDNFTNYGVVNPEELSYLFAERGKKFKAQVHDVDIRNADLVDQTFLSFRPEMIIHLASFPRQKVVSADPAGSSQVMSTGLINMLESSSRHNIKKFTYISSSMVYGDFEDNIREDAICNPQGQYGIMKLMGELLVKDYTRRGYFDHVIIRPSAVYGELDVEDRVVSKFMLAAIRNQTLKVNGATERLDFTYVDDAAMGIVQASLSANATNKTYNITKSHSRSLLDVANLAIKIVGNGRVECKDKDSEFPSRGALNIDAARKDFNFNPMVEVEEGLQRYFNWFNSSPFWKSNL